MEEARKKLRICMVLVVAAAILLMAYELIRDSVGKIVHPEETEFSGLIVVILVLSILVKLYMFLYNRRLGKKLASPAMEATAMDSLSDSVATAAVLIATGSEVATLVEGAELLAAGMQPDCPVADDLKAAVDDFLSRQEK